MAGMFKNSMSDTLLVVMALVAISPSVCAHGERAQEPFLRMRTIQWYDVEWSKASVAVNEEVVVKGKFRVAPERDWPRTAAKPDLAFLNISIPGPVFVRKSSSINGINMANSTTFENGRDYGFEVILKARHPGRWHVHSMVNIKNAGPIVGPGEWIEVTGSHADFINEVTTLTGEVVNLDTYGTSNNIFWHVLWGAIAAFWLGYWLMQPLFFKRNRLLLSGREDELITPRDRKVSLAILGLAIGITVFGYYWAEAKWPHTLPLQSAQEHVDPLPLDESSIDVKLVRATYRVPGRSMNMTLEITNNSYSAARLGEFNTATIRFINPDVGFMDNTSASYPDHLMAEAGLQGDDMTIAAGETKTIEVTAQDAAWEVERLSTLIYDPDSRFGGLLLFYTENGDRIISNVGGVLVPEFI